MKRKVGLGLLWSGLFSMAFSASAAPLPSDLKLVVNVSGEGTQTLHLHKRTARTSDFVLYLWDSVSGYVAQPTPEVRTFRGTVGENPNAIVIASIDGGNRLKAYCIDMEWGHNRRWNIDVDVSSQLASPQPPDPMPTQSVASPANGTAGTPNVGPKVPSGISESSGVPYGEIVEFEFGLDMTVAAYNRYGGDIDTLLARYEIDAMMYEFMMTRDLMIRVVLPTTVIRTENFYTTDPGNMSLGEMRTAWLTEPLASARWDNVWGSEGYYASGNGVGKDENSMAAGALFHENAHNWTAYHLAYQADTMGGNKPSFGPMTVDTILKKRKEAIDESKLPVAAPFTDPLPPHTHVDISRVQQDTPIDIDVMANDHDANGDALSIVDFTTTTVPGGTVTLNGNQLHYTPPAGYVGKDIIVYTVQDDSPMGLKTRDVVHLEVVNNGLMVRYEMEETSGTSASDSTGIGVPGDLNGADFSTHSVPSPLGKGVRTYGYENENAIENGDWSGILVGTGNIMPVPLNPSREATPLEEDWNHHSGYYDIMDGDYTFASWFRCDNFNGSFYNGGFGMAYLASRWWHPETRVGWDLYAMDGKVGLHWRIFDGATAIQHLSASYDFKEGAWYHVAAVFDRTADEIRILVNGQVVATRTSAFASNGFIFNGRAPLALGEFAKEQICFDDVRIYSKALSTAEVQALYELPGVGVARFLGDTLQYAAYSDFIFEQSLWENIWSGGAEPLTFEILDGPAWLTVDSDGLLRGMPYPSDAGLNMFTVKMSDTNGNTDTMTLEITVPVVPTANRIAYWKLDEGSGSTATDDTGNGYDGSLTGAIWEDGRIHGALSFNGTSDSVTCGNVPASSQMTFAGWINPSDVSGSQALFGKASSYSVKMSGSELQYTKPHVGDYSSSGAGLTPGTWQHVVVTLDGGYSNGLKFYKDGVLVSQRTGATPGVNSNPVLLANNEWNEHFGGLMDDLQIFNKVLTPDEVGALYASASSGVGLFAHWKFDEGSGLTAADSSVNGYDGTLDSSINWIAGMDGNAVALTPTQTIDLGGKTGPEGDWTLATWVQRKGNTPSAILLDSSSTAIKLEQWPSTHRIGITKKHVWDKSFNYTTPLNQWVHLTWVGGNGEVKLYVNGVWQDTIAQSISLPFSTIGHASEGVNTWLDDTVIYNRALRESEVRNVYLRDLDLDGMRDAWEEAYFPDNGTATRPHENADADINSNLGEYIAGMDPTNAASYFGITDGWMAPGQGFVIEWESFGDRLYSLYWSQSLTNDFQYLDEVTGPQNSYTDAVHHAEDTGFYNVEVHRVD